jgi:hypothetical protein
MINNQYLLIIMFVLVIFFNHYNYPLINNQYLLIIMFVLVIFNFHFHYLLLKILNLYLFCVDDMISIHHCIIFIQVFIMHYP